MNKIPSLFLVAISIFLFHAESFAAPAISSVSANPSSGGTLTISGSGFGTKSPATPLLWDTFDNGTLGNAIQNTSATIGTWNSGIGSNDIYYSNAITGYGGSGKVARAPFNSGNSSLAKNATSFPTLYIDFRIYWPSSNAGAYNYPCNYKPWRVYGTRDMEISKGFGCEAPGNNYQVVNLYENGSYKDNSFAGTSWVVGSWEHYQFIWNEGTNGVADGTYIILRNCLSDNYHLRNIMVRNGGNTLSDIRIGHYLDKGSRGCGAINSNAVTYIDSVYIDTTWARVAIGDASTYATCRHREIQIPEAWSDSSITIKVNQGSFAVGDTVYLYVVDEKGVVNPNGYPVKIQSAVPPPSAPTGLHIVQ